MIEAYRGSPPRGRPFFGRFADLSPATVQSDARGGLDAIAIGEHPTIRETTFAYDSLGRLQAVPSGDATEYVLDPAGRRIGKRVNGVLEQAWLCQDGLRPIAELDGMGNVVASFVYATGVPDYMVRGGVTYRILRDQLGSVRLVIDVASGTVAQRMEHDEWGRVTFDSAPGFEPFGYAGGLWDPDAGLVHFGAGEYDAETGRWTSKDPIGFGAGDANLYGYVLGDPLDGLDPTGRVDWRIWAGGAVGGLVGGLLGYGACNSAENARRFERASTADAGLGNALGHCYWSCELSATQGHVLGPFWVTSHELEAEVVIACLGDEAFDYRDSAIDRFNNAAGISFGRDIASADSVAGCAARCLAAGERRELLYTAWQE